MNAIHKKDQKSKLKWIIGDGQVIFRVEFTTMKDEEEFAVDMEFPLTIDVDSFAEYELRMGKMLENIQRSTGLRFDAVEPFGRTGVYGLHIVYRKEVFPESMRRKLEKETRNIRELVTQYWSGK